jgi:glycerol-3-phosphate responsive antiterminator
MGGVERTPPKVIAGGFIQRQEEEAEGLKEKVEEEEESSVREREGQ